MSHKIVSEKESIKVASDLLDYLKTIDNGSINNIFTSNDEESRRDNVGWYQHKDDEHIININIPNIYCFNRFVASGLADTDAYYAFLCLCINHEFRHFMQGRCIWEGKEIDGYGQNDVLNAQAMLYVRYFFDAYYLLNKGYVKYEEDAEKFAVRNTAKFLKERFPNMDVSNAVVNAVRLYATLQSNGGISSTLPENCDSLEEITSKIDERIEKNLRVTPLNRTLFVHNQRFYGNHGYFGLDEDTLLTEKLIKEYESTKDGSTKDLLVAGSIYDALEKKEESLQEFPVLKRKLTK